MLKQSLMLPKFYLYIKGEDYYMYKGNVPKFTLRKLSVGIVSLGAGVALMGTTLTTTVHADEATAGTATTTSTTTEADSSETETSHSTSTETTAVVSTPLETESSEAPKQVEEKKEDSELESSVTKVENDTVVTETLTKPKTETEPKTEIKTEYKLVNEKKEGVSDIKEEKKVQDSNIISKKEKTDLFDVTRESSIDETGTLTVTTTINPKEIDHGAEVIVLLDTSRKMVQADSGEAFKKAKEKIKELVTTLVGEGATHGQRNSVRIITFDKHASELHNLTADNIDKTLNNIDTDTKYRNQYGVALQEAIHKARTTFDSEREKAEKNKTIKYNKRQHIVLFSQGEATFSYDLTDKTKATKQDINEDVTYSYPMWPFYFDTTVSKGNIVTDAQSALELLGKFGINIEDAKKAIPLANIVNKTLGLFGAFLGADNPLDYRTLKEFKYDGKDASQFDYSNKIGEGYNYRSFSDIDTNRPDGALEFIKEKVKNAVSKDTKALETLQYYFPFVKTATDATIDAVLDRLFHPRSYIFHNHNLAAKAEAKLAQNADIKVYSVDVTTDTNFEKFDNYLKSMSDNENMLEISKNNTELATKFRDTLKNITITDTLKDILDISTLVKPDSLKYEDKKESSWFGTIQKSILTWSLDKDAIKEAFEQGKPLTVTYKIKVKTPHNSKRPETAISPELKYTINDKTEKASYILQDIKFKQVESKVDKIVETHSEGIVELDSKLAPISGSNAGSIDDQVEIIDDTTTPKKPESGVEPKDEKPQTDGETTPENDSTNPQGDAKPELDTPENDNKGNGNNSGKETMPEKPETKEPEVEEKPEAKEPEVEDKPELDTPEKDDQGKDSNSGKDTMPEKQPEADKQPKVESKPETKAAATKQSSASRANQSSANQKLPSTGDKELVLATLLGIELMFTAGLCARRKED
ncbi:serum opacification factor [Streptococcus hillyeri]|nr:serum opacification factor [Streptococcus hillyeri]